MNIVDNIGESLRYPLKDWVKILILTVITIIPIVNFMSAGYFLRIIKSTLAGIDEVPEFDDLGGLFIDGIKILIAGIIYMIVPIIIFFIAALLAGPATVTDGSGMSYVPFYALSGLSLVLMVIGIILAFLVSLIFYPAMVNMALYDSDLGAAFKFSEILDNIKTIGWGNYIIWIIAIIVTSAVAGIVIWFVGLILLIILIGFLVWFLGGAYLSMFQARSLGLLFAEYIE